MSIEQQLTGGHPNSLGNTIDVVDKILAGNLSFDELFNCYFSENEVVRLRVSNAMKRIYHEKPSLLLPYLDRFLNEISQINQPSTQWTMCQLFFWMSKDMSSAQLAQAKEHVKRYITHTTDWIVENTAMQTLADWSQSDPELRAWLKPIVEKYLKSSRKSVANRARKIHNALYDA